MSKCSCPSRYFHHEACPFYVGEHPTGDGRERSDAQGKYVTVKGRSMKMTRLDAQGQPMGDPVVVEAAATLGFEAQFPETDISTISVDITFQEVDPTLIALLTGTGDFSPGTEHAMDMWMPVKRTFWQWLRRKPRQRQRYYLPNVKIGEVDSDG